MLPESTPGNSVFVEITNPVHGGPGWEFGSCLWSPVYDARGAKAWKIMETISPGDIILHLLKRKGTYFWAGVSRVESPLSIVHAEPPRPTRWANMSPYQRIDVGHFTRVDPLLM